MYELCAYLTLIKLRILTQSNLSVELSIRKYAFCSTLRKLDDIICLTCYIALCLLASCILLLRVSRLIYFPTEVLDKSQDKLDVK